MNTKGASVFTVAALDTMSATGAATSTFPYVTDFRNGHVLVYNEAFANIPLLPTQFVDDTLPTGFSPFNIQNIGGDLYVTDALQESAKNGEPVLGAGLGYVDVYSSKGVLLRRLQHGSWLDSPWGLAQAPGDFGLYSHDVLVGQYGSGTVAVYDPVTGAFKAMLLNSSNTPLTISGLRGLTFAGGGSNGLATTLYFTAGTAVEKHGLFGSITPVENIWGNAN